MGCVRGLVANSQQPGPADLSLARETMAGLRQTGVLDEVVEKMEGLVVYPAGLGAESA
jgi:hypothetical protein